MSRVFMFLVPPGLTEWCAGGQLQQVRPQEGQYSQQDQPGGRGQEAVQEVRGLPEVHQTKHHLHTDTQEHTCSDGKWWGVGGDLCIWRI